MQQGAPPARTTHTPDMQYAFELTEAGLLGSGAHGVVRAARHVTHGDLVAVKVMPASVLGAVAKELIAQAKMHHPNIVQLYSTQVDLDKRRVYMLMELCRGGELFDRIAEQGKLDEDSAREYLVQAARAIAYCHSQNVFHRDLKPENILLDDNDNVKIADFGLAALAQQTREDASFLQHTKCGSIMYAAPEVLVSSAQTGYDAAKADVWSLGIILYSMLSGALPFRMAVPHKCPRYAIVQQRGVRILCEANGFSAEATNLLVSMLNPNPTERLSAAEILKTSWALASTDASPPQPIGMAKWSVLRGDKGADPNAGSAGVVGAQSGEKRALSEADGTEGDAAQAGKRRALSPGQAASTKTATPGLQGASAPAVPPTFGADELDEVVPEGVNGMLVRSLGWVQLPEEKERMVGDVASALDSLGVKYEVVKGELSDVVWVGPTTETDLQVADISQAPRTAEVVEPSQPLLSPRDSEVGVSRRTTADTSARSSADRNGTESPAEGGMSVGVGSATNAAGGLAAQLSADSPAASEGHLCVRLRIHHDAEGSSNLHITRHSGDVLQFHSFYRDVRNQLAGVNGWVNNSGRYEHVVPE